MTLPAGARLGPYEIVSLRGRGGMGEVYLARDPRLERDVAIKVLPRRLSRDPVFRQRFEREAKTLSRLSHPHVCTLHDVGSEKVPDGHLDYLVLEYLEGETLEERLGRGPLPLVEVIELGCQIAEALHAAHLLGIIHRDLKPGNVLLTRGGAKVLDFGLAKGLGKGADAEEENGGTQTPTRSAPLTAEGSILGTLPYMAPEQLEGKEADERSDVWALGAVLYQMATAARPFAGASRASLVAAIMTGQARAPSELEPLVPPRLDWLIARCLEKSPERRFQSAHDVALELRSLAEVSSGLGATPARLPARTVAVALAVAVALGLFGGLLLARRSRGGPATGEEVWTATQLDTPSLSAFPALSPDGRTVVFGKAEDGPARLYLRSLDALVSRPIAGSEGVSFASFSPDGTELAMVEGGDLKTRPLEGGGTGAAIVENVSTTILWGEDGYLYYSPRLPGIGASPEKSQAWRVPARGGEPERLGTGGASALLPGARILLTSAPSTRERGFWADVLAVDLASGESRVLVAGTQPFYLEPGFLIFYRERRLWAAPFDGTTGQLDGTPQSIETDVARAPPTVDLGLFFVSRSGDLVYTRGGRTDRWRLVWVRRNGEVEPAASEVKDFETPNVSLDGRQVAATAHVEEGFEQWILDLSTGSWSRPSQSGSTWSAQWLPPDGRQILFTSTRVDGHGQVFVQAADRSTPAERLWPSDDNQVWLDVSPDGRWVLLFNVGQEGFFVLDRESGDVRTVIESGEVYSADFDPSGDWIAYSRRKGGPWPGQIWVVPFPEPGEPRQVTIDGGQEPRWSPSGEELYYRGPTHVMAMPVERIGDTLRTGRPQTLFEDRFRRRMSGLQNYAVAPDGRFLMMESAESAESTESSLVLVQNWRAKVEHALAAGGHG